MRFSNIITAFAVAGLAAASVVPAVPLGDALKPATKPIAATVKSLLAPLHSNGSRGSANSASPNAAAAGPGNSPSAVAPPATDGAISASSAEMSSGPVLAPDSPSEPTIVADNSPTPPLTAASTTSPAKWYIIGVKKTVLLSSFSEQLHAVFAAAKDAAGETPNVIQGDLEVIHAVSATMTDSMLLTVTGMEGVLYVEADVAVAA